MTGRHAFAVALAAGTAAVTVGALPTPQKADAGNRVVLQSDACFSAPAAVQLVRSLITAINNGADATVDRLVAREPAFQWFSVGSRDGEKAKDRSTLRAYVRQRHRQRERWTLVRMDGNGRGISLTVTREAADLPRRTHLGKAAAICANDKLRLIVWAL